jgi:large subunit ribosomal protein L3
MKYSILAKKIGMTQIFDDSNRLLPVTVLEAGPCPVVQVKSKATDGYNAVQIGFGAQKEHRLTKAERGHLAKGKVSPVRELREFRTETPEDYKVGDILTVDAIEAGIKVDVIGTTKGKGFQGVMKRFGYAGGPASHGSMFHRRGGSFGCRQTPGHVYKGKNMPGHQGDVQRTVQNLVVVKTIPEKNLVLVLGSLPGPNGSTVLIRPAKKAKANKAA